MSNEAILSVENLSKNFGGLAALSEVSFEVPKGVIFGLIGPNGSGKTTMFNCISGVYKINGGKVTFNGQDITNLPSFKICHLGIGRTYQNVRPFSSLTVYQNIRSGYMFSGKSHKGVSEEEEIRRIIDFVGLTGKEEEIAGGLPLAMRKRLEIGRALISKPELLLLDEVAAGLNLTESQEIVELVHSVNKEGITILMVEHVMPIIMTVCNHIVVLAEGKKIAEGNPSEISQNQKVIESYLGAEAMKEVNMDEMVQ